MDKLLLDDTSVVAFLAVLNFKITPQKKTDGKVGFLIEGAGIDRALEALYNNTTVGILDYIKAFKGLRSSIFALKGGQR